MKDFFEYLEVILLLSPLLLFIVAVAFRLLDNSGFLFLQKEILVDSSYVSLKNLQEQLKTSADVQFQKKIRRILLYRKLHRLFLFSIIPAFPVTIYTYLFLF